ncbi:MAG: SGNH/GDSL hydrolase family protein, partial [Planctomycetota bacterium]
MNSNDANKSNTTNRRGFLKTTAIGFAGSMLARDANAQAKKKIRNLRDLIDRVVLRRDDVDGFLDPKEPNWAAFDPELGYVLHNSYQKDGLDGAWSIYRYGKQYGERKTINFADKPCRLNTYGDSFTQCHQVSDGETWQEYLAAHLGEPIRNFGVGGYGVYQAYRRLLRTEKTDCGTPYVILNIWGTDDHYRSLDAWRYPRCYGFFTARRDAHIFHANPWDHIGFDLNTGKVVEKKNVCPTRQSLYNLCDKDFIYETFKDDPALNMFYGCRVYYEPNTKVLKDLSEALGLKLDFSSTGKRAASTRTLYWECARRSTMWILERIQEFVKKQNKKFLLLLSYQQNLVLEACRGKPRADRD